MRGVPEEPQPMGVQEGLVSAQGRKAVKGVLQPSGHMATKARPKVVAEGVESLGLKVETPQRSTCGMW